MITVLRRPYSWVRHQTGALMFERRLGVAHRVAYLERFGLDHEDRVFYIASRWRSLRRALRGHRVTETDVFLDLGSGMGRMVLEAARYPFHRVIGVELVTEMHQFAEQNLRSYRGRLRCRDVLLVNSDVEHDEIPDDVTVVYMFNPFRGSIFGTALTSSELRGPMPTTARSRRRNPVEEETAPERAGSSGRRR